MVTTALGINARFLNSLTMFALPATTFIVLLLKAQPLPLQVTLTLSPRFSALATSLATFVLAAPALNPAMTLATTRAATAPPPAPPLGVAGGVAPVFGPVVVFELASALSGTPLP